MESIRHQPREMTIAALDNLYESTKKRRIDGGPGSYPRSVSRVFVSYEAKIHATQSNTNNCPSSFKKPCYRFL